MQNIGADISTFHGFKPDSNKEKM